MREGPDDPPWRLTCVYGEPRVEDRHNTWSLLQSMRMQYDLPWLVVGDFNECVWDFKHFSATPRAASQMQASRDVLELCVLTYLSFVGVPYTYDNKSAGSTNVKVCLDRVLVNREWLLSFIQTSAMVVPAVTSDHVPILVQGRASCSVWRITGWSWRTQGRSFLRAGPKVPGHSVLLTPLSISR